MTSTSNNMVNILSKVYQENILIVD